MGEEQATIHFRLLDVDFCYVLHQRKVIVVLGEL